MAQAKLQRTEEELNDSRFNYFIAYKIDINENDAAKIETRIKTSASSTDGKVYLRRLLNELKNDAVEIMCHDAVFEDGSYKPNKNGRKQEAARATQFKKKEARGIIDILCQTRKTLLKSEILDIFDKINKPVMYFAEDEFFNEITSYLSGLGVKVIDNTDSTIPFVDFQKTEKFLETLNPQPKDLYDFLGVANNASAADIKTASGQKYSEVSKTGDLKKKQSCSNLCGNVKKILLDKPDTRKAYDQYLLMKKDIWDEFQKRKDVAIRELSMDEYRDYTQKTINLLKVPVEEAEKIIAIGCKYFQMGIIGKSDENMFEYCPFPDCGKLYEKGAKTCPHCGRALEIICWNCHAKTRITRDDRGCQACGATLKSHEIFNQKCQEMDRLFVKPGADTGEMQSVLLAIKNVVPGYPAKPESAVAKKIKEYEGEIQRKIHEEQTVGANYKQDYVKIEKLVAIRNYETALNGAMILRRTYPGYNFSKTLNLINDIKKFTDPASEKAKRARTFLSCGDERQAVREAVQALETCPDCSEAKQILQKCTPRPIAGIRATGAGNSIRIDWTDSSAQEYVGYTVIKKIGVAPATPDDGVVVAQELNIKFFEDTNVLAATPYYYGVYAERYGAKSKILSVVSPVLLFPDVSDIKQEFVIGGIKLSWNVPKNVKTVFVKKREGTVAPLSAAEGEPVDCQDKGLYDGECNAESAYSVFCKYEVNGKTVVSRGVKYVCKPFREIKPLKYAKLSTAKPCGYVLNYAGEKNDGSKVDVYFCRDRIELKTDAVNNLLNFGSVCKNFSRPQIDSSAENAIGFSIPPETMGWIYPVISNDQLFMVSKPFPVNTLSGLKGVSFAAQEGTVEIKGILDGKASGIKVKIHHERFPETPDDGDCEEFDFSKEDFAKNNNLRFNLRMNTDNYISLFAVFEQGGEKIFSAPIKLGSPVVYRETVRILYTLDYKVSPTKPFKMTIKFAAEIEAEIPELLLVRGAPRPLDKNSGVVCERLPGLRLKKGLFDKMYVGKHVIMINPVSLDMKFAIFADTGADYIKLREVGSL